LTTISTLLLSCALFLPTAGCNVLGFGAHVAGGGSNVKAMHTLAPGGIVVLVENFRSPAAHVSEADLIARWVTSELTERKLGPMIDPTRVQGIGTTRPAEYRRMTIPAIGRELGATQVLYVNLTSFEVEQTPGTDMLKGRAAALVRVVDTATSETIWPKELANGYAVYSETPLVKLGEGVDSYLFREELAKSIALKVSRLFHSYNTP
jgi:hypothetical protein